MVGLDDITSSYSYMYLDYPYACMYDTDIYICTLSPFFLSACITTCMIPRKSFLFPRLPIDNFMRHHDRDTRLCLPIWDELVPHVPPCAHRSRSCPTPQIEWGGPGTACFPIRFYSPTSPYALQHCQNLPP